MVKWLVSIVCGSLFISACASSMTPQEVNETLPKLTKATFLTQAQAEENVKASKCKYLVRNRNYVAPMGMTTQDDLRKGAKGIDEWVKLDCGNAYVLRNFRWVAVANEGTQLHIDFDTMLCK